MQGRIARGAVLGFKFSDKLVEARLVGDVGAGELQDALASEGVFERLFAYGAFAANKCALSPRAASVRGARHDVVVDAAHSSRMAADD
jgi:hypothetical protein